MYINISFFLRFESESLGASVRGTVEVGFIRKRNDRCFTCCVYMCVCPIDSVASPVMQKNLNILSSGVKQMQ